MARIRTVKPSFFRHHGLFRLEQNTGMPMRVAFAGLWTCADREGRFRWIPEELKLDCLPHDSVDFSVLMDALVSAGFLVKYESADQTYGLIPSWKEHQHINQREPESALPAPGVTRKPKAPQRTATGAHIPRGENVPKRLREAVLARDGNKCRRCPATDDLTVDHIFPRSMGGTHAPANLRTLCRPCNAARPVAGDALIRDLAVDGFTVEDMPRICAHVQARGEREREGEGKEDSEAIASGADAPLAEPSEQDLVWGDGLAWLAKAEGKPAAPLRSMVGRWCKVYGDAHVLACMTEARSTSPPVVGPVAWIEAALKARNRDGNQGRKASQRIGNGFITAGLEDAQRRAGGSG